MKKMLSSLFTMFLVVTGLSACHYSGGGVVIIDDPNPCTSCGDYWSHDELAREFVRRVNSEIVGFDLDLVKINTLQYDYIVVYDWDYGTYDAYYLGDFDPYGNLANYINSYEDWFYYDLVDQWDGTYRDPITGTRFEKAQASGKNLAKMKAFKEMLTIQKVADKLRADYGLSADKAQDTARFAYRVQNSASGTYNKADYDAFAKELTGSTITEFQNDLKDGNLTSLASRIDKAAQTTGVGPEGVNKLINEMFMK